MYTEYRNMCNCTCKNRQTRHTRTQTIETCFIVHVRTCKWDIHIHRIKKRVIVHVRTGKRDIKHNTEWRSMCKLHHIIHYSTVVGASIFCIHNIRSNGVLPALFQNWSLVKDIVLENQHWSCKRLENDQNLSTGDIQGYCSSFSSYPMY